MSLTFLELVQGQYERHHYTPRALVLACFNSYHFEVVVYILFVRGAPVVTKNLHRSVQAVVKEIVNKTCDLS